MRPGARTQPPPLGLPLRSRIVIALVGAMIVGAKAYLRMPIHVPGHSGVLWMGLLLIGAGIVGRTGAGTMIGLISGSLAIIIAPGHEGVFVAVKYVAPGVVVDVLTPLLGGRLDRYPAAIVVAAAAHMAKLTSSYLMGLALGVPGGYLAVGLGLAAVTHLVFGGMGGWIAAFVLRRLEMAGLQPHALQTAVETVAPQAESESA